MSIRLWRHATARWRQDSGSPAPFSTADPSARAPASRRGARSGGQSVVEFALIIPVFLVLAATAIDLGRIYYSQITVNDAAREGALEAARNPGSYIANTDCTAANKNVNEVMCRTLNEARGGFVTVSPTDVIRTCSTGTCPPAAPAFGDTVSIKVTGHFTLVTPLLGTFFGGQSITFSSTASAQLYVYPTAATSAAPLANFTANPTTGPVQLLVAFTDASTGGPTTWAWDFGDGGTSLLPSPSHTYTATGSFDAVLTASNAGGSSVKHQTIVVTAAVPAPPVANFTANPMSGPAPLTVTFADQSTGVPTSWAWDFGDGSTSTAQNPLPHQYLNTGNFFVKLKVTNAGGNDTQTQQITTNVACQAPVASFSVSPASGKKKQAVFTVTDTSTNMAAAGCNNIWSWNWGDGTGNTSLQSPPGHTYQSQGPYTIQLSVSNTAGTSTVSHVVTVTP
jgi:PKD repeat protein